jgi:release factor glutamine methyltransferase
VIRDQLRSLAAALPGDSPVLDAQVLLAHVTGQNRTWVLSHPEAELNTAQEKALTEALERLKQGEPLPYVLGHWEFFGLDFSVTPDVLIPRPETELLVETALDWLKTHPGRRALDIGTGSGCIPVAIAYACHALCFIATDISLPALEVAKHNAKKQGVSNRVLFIQADLFPRGLLASSFDLVTANLPYIPTATMQELPIFGREPALALDGGADGLDLIRQLLARLATKPAKGGLILLEIENRQGAAANALARENFPDANIQIKKDLAGHERLVVIQLP